METLKIGLVDFGYRDPRLNPLKIIEDVIDYTYQADKLGFSRMWLTELHTPFVKRPWSDPQALMPILAGSTERISVGQAGVITSIHNPYHVASTYKLLSNIFPDRIDLGLANGIVGDRVATYTLKERSKNIPALFEENTNKILNFLKEEDELLNGGDGVVLPPYKGKTPKTWTLGLSAGSMKRALAQQTHYCRSLFHSASSMEYNKAEVKEYKEDYFQKYNSYPTVCIALAGSCHYTSEKAQKYINFLNKTVVGKGEVYGCPSRFYDEIMKIKEAYSADEIMLLSAAFTPKDRAIELELISKTFGLDSK